MEYRLPFGAASLPFQVPRRLEVHLFRPRRDEKTRPWHRTLEKALESPVDSLPLERLVSKKDRILILCDDETRPTPLHRMLPLILQRFTEAGIPKRRIRILMAYGLHKPMDQSALIRKLGPQTLSGFSVIHHDAFSRKNLYRAGETASGAPVDLNRVLCEADFTMGIGNLSLSKEAGYGGGAKIVMPGAAGARTIYASHAMVADHPNQVGVIEGNPIRREIEECGKMGNLRFIVNTILDEEDRICRVVAGEPLSAFNQGISEFNEVYQYPLERPFDLLLVSSSPMDGEFYQANKALTVSSLGVRDGGMIIMAAPCSKGLSPFPYFDDLVTSSRTFAQWQDLMRRPGFPHQVAGEICLGLRYLMDVRKITLGLISSGIRPETVAKMGFLPFSTMESALESALRRLGRNALVGIVPKGPMTLFKISCNALQGPDGPELLSAQV